MKYFIFSDVHGFYDELMDALNESGFDINNQEHCIISCGDLMDRGSKPLECLKFVNNLYDQGRAIIIKGNHDILLEDCLSRGYCLGHDFHNGTNQTIDKLCNPNCNMHSCDEIFENVRNNHNLIKYQKSLINYYETDKYIFCHSWIPTISEGDYFKYLMIGIDSTYDPNWREASDEDWGEAMWGNPFNMAALGLNQTGKTIVFGHWHTSWQWSRDGVGSEWGEDAKFEPYHSKNFIGIDACTAFSGKVNILVVEDNVYNN